MVVASTMEVVGRPRLAQPWLRYWVYGDHSHAGRSLFAPGMPEVSVGKAAGMSEHLRRELLLGVGPDLLFRGLIVEGLTLDDLTRSSVACALPDLVLGWLHSLAPSYPHPLRLHQGSRLYPSHLCRGCSSTLGK